LTATLYDLAITGNIYFNGITIINGTILVAGERISCISDKTEGFKAKNHIDAREKWILPGVIDAHVHSYSNPKEGFANATRSACAGGVTTIIDMPVDVPEGIATPEALERKKDLIVKDSYVDVALLGSVKNHTLEHIKSLQQGGVCGFKISLFDTDPDRFPRVNDGKLYQAFLLIAETGLTAGLHAENDEIIKTLIKEAVKEGKIDPLAHCETRPEISETESVLKGLEIARATGVCLHFYHISCARSLDLVQHYRREGCPVTVETCPHYLVFSEDDMQRLGAKLRINPPIRKESQVNRLWQRLETGDIDCVASDHAPWSLEHKSRPSIFENACGTPGVETLMPVLWSEGIERGRIGLRTLIRSLMENPAKIFGLYPRKGILAPGSDADMIVFNPETKWRIDGTDMHTSADWTPYEGMDITGRVETTIVRGKVIYDQGEIKGERGYGRFVRPAFESR
jgi:allantoinase